ERAAGQRRPSGMAAEVALSSNPTPVCLWRIAAMRGSLLVLSLAFPWLVQNNQPSLADDKSAAKDGYVTIFNGKNLDGWHISAKTGHSGKSKNKTGGKWVALDGALVGSQDIPGNGGIIITDK